MTQSCAQFVDVIKHFEQNGERFTWKHLYREANQDADILSKHGLSLVSDSHVFYFVSLFFILSCYG